MGGRTRGTTCLYLMRSHCWAAEGQASSKEPLPSAGGATWKQPTNSPLHHDYHPVAASGRARGIYANGAPKVGGQAPEQIVPARWNSTAPFAANMPIKHTRLTAPGYQRALFAAGSCCDTRAFERGPRHWHTRTIIRPCRRRTVCFVPAPVRQSKITLTQWLRSGTCQRASTYE